MFNKGLHFHPANRDLREQEPLMLIMKKMDQMQQAMDHLQQRLVPLLPPAHMPELAA